MSDIQLALTNTAGISSVMSFWGFVAASGVRRWQELLWKAASAVMIIGFVCLSVAIVERGIEAQRFPLANLYESLLWFAWATMGAYIFLSFVYGVKQLGWLASLTATTVFLYGSWLPQSQHEITPLVPALVSYWRQIHVPPLIISYAMFFLSGLSGLIELSYAGRLHSILFSIAALIMAALAIALGTFTNLDSYLLQGLFVGGSLLGMGLAWQSLNKAQIAQVNLKLAERYDDIGYRLISVGFPLLTIGVITGGLWANHAWGTYWSWDPKESMALVTWLCYAIYIHLRVHKECSAEKLSLVAVGGLLLTLLTYLGFNSLGFGGLHSYGKFK